MDECNNFYQTIFNSVVKCRIGGLNFTILNLHKEYNVSLCCRCRGVAFVILSNEIHVPIPFQLFTLRKNNILPMEVTHKK